MATLNTAEQRAAIDGLLKSAKEDSNEAGIILAYLETVLPTFGWAALLRTRAALWQPFIDDGLSISAWCDEVIRLANIQLAQ
jgi:hypothetical protein